MKVGNIQDMTIPLMVVMGKRESSVAEVAQIQEGTILELDSLAGEPVVLYAAEEPIAKGEVVVIDENFGIRVTQVITRRPAQGGEL